MALFKSKAHNEPHRPNVQLSRILEMADMKWKRRLCRWKRRNFLPLFFLWNQDIALAAQIRRSRMFTVELHPWRQTACRRGSSALDEREWSCAEDEGTLPIPALSCYWFSGWPAITIKTSKGLTLWDRKLNWYSPMWDPQWVRDKAPMTISWWTKNC